MTAEGQSHVSPFETVEGRSGQWVDRLLGWARKLLRGIYGVTMTVAPRLPVFHSALRFPKESASEREGFIIQASA
jgi:hypothetical protein